MICALYGHNGRCDTQWTILRLIILQGIKDYTFIQGSGVIGVAVADGVGVYVSVGGGEGVNVSVGSGDGVCVLVTVGEGDGVGVSVSGST